MSKRLQVVMPEDEYEAVQRVARRRGKRLSELVRESLRRTTAEEVDEDPERRIAAVLRFARYSGPTGEIDDILAGIERGRGPA
jgi:hypothetical protein